MGRRRGVIGGTPGALVYGPIQNQSHFATSRVLALGVDVFPDRFWERLQEECGLTADQADRCVYPVFSALTGSWVRFDREQRELVGSRMAQLERVRDLLLELLPLLREHYSESRWRFDELFATLEGQQIMDHAYSFDGEYVVDALEVVKRDADRRANVLLGKLQPYKKSGNLQEERFDVWSALTWVWVRDIKMPVTAGEDGEHGQPTGYTTKFLTLCTERRLPGLGGRGVRAWLRKHGRKIEADYQGLR